MYDTKIIADMSSTNDRNKMPIMEMEKFKKI
jgi:hypothetical protein